jgi:hypothetical protein
VNNNPLLLGNGEEPTKENVNRMVRRMGHRHIDPARDTIAAVTKAGPNFISQFEWMREYYPDWYTPLDEMAEAAGEED